VLINRSVSRDEAPRCVMWPFQNRHFGARTRLRRAQVSQRNPTWCHNFSHANLVADSNQTFWGNVTCPCDGFIICASTPPLGQRKWTQCCVGRQGHSLFLL